MCEENQKWDHEPSAGELGLCDGGPADQYRPERTTGEVGEPYDLIAVRIPASQRAEIDKAVHRTGQTMDEFIVGAAYRTAQGYNRVVDWAELQNQNARAAADVPPAGHPLREAAEDYARRPRPIRDNPQA